MAWHHYLNRPREAKEVDSQSGTLIGPAYSDAEIEEFLRRQEAHYEKFEKERLVEQVAKLIDEGNVIGWFQGRMEFGPRALGARSIIGDARNREMQSRMNLKIKFRESFRPFAPSVLKEKVSEWFELQDESPYMLLVADVDKKHRVASANGSLKGLAQLKEARSSIPAVTHVDDSARVQTVDSKRHGIYYDLVRQFHDRTGCPVIINTSFNVRGEPIVCSPEDAFRCFMGTEMDYLVMGSFVLDKRKQKEVSTPKGTYFELD